MVRNRFLGEEIMNLPFNFLRVLMKKYWLGNRRERFYGEMWGNAVLGGVACENPLRLSMYDGPMETAKYKCVNIWCILDWIVRLREIHFLGI